VRVDNANVETPPVVVDPCCVCTGGAFGMGVVPALLKSAENSWSQTVTMHLLPA
jgi:hypothetical protein